MTGQMSAFGFALTLGIGYLVGGLIFMLRPRSRGDC